ncbi:PQQ-binding-like beta-propeller repeat protein [Spirosoma panaciterrae]|uniref:outer membrane protein assembly factor BamB family protein n=1 Tax=Spirosoma panaciterrae TaxID=496058 RepID=UPI000365DF6E|nr:PQQ-binding-like beta-propeller repeat protein [Spirosoma panaciterrae]
MKRAIFSTFLFGLLAMTSAFQGIIWHVSSQTEWPEYLGGPDRNHYSSLHQIDSTNVNKLHVAWEYATQDSGQMQCNPIVVKGVLYGMTASCQPFALDAATGKERWRWQKAGAVAYNNSRGVTYWQSSTNGADQRILFTNGPWLYALDANTGREITSFGKGGRTSIKAGLGAVAQDRFVVSNTPGTVFGDLLILPLRVSDGIDPAPGHIQAFNIRTGKLAWVFRTVPNPGEYGYDTWPKNAYRNPDIGGVNNWPGMAIDRARSIVYLPTGSAAADYYGGNRVGRNLFANCLLALDARTGKRLWHYQLVHHDILDRDPPAPPNLITILHGGNRIDAVAQVTKHGVVFIFDRVTGKPIYPITEKRTPSSDIPGEKPWPTQPVPSLPAPYARQNLTEADISPFAENRDELLATFRKSRYEGSFTPYSRQGTVVFPGFDGGAEWGGAAADPDGVLYLNSNEMAWLVRLAELEMEMLTATKQRSSGRQLYVANCEACHGAERTGNPAGGYPSLINIGNRRKPEYIQQIIANGKGMMPAFSHLSEVQRQTLVTYLLNRPATTNEPGQAAKEPGQSQHLTKQTTVPYRVALFTKFLDSNGLPAIRPPWGTLNAIDLNTGMYRWKIPFGEYPELVAKGIHGTGAESYGGPVVTASGLLFIAGTKDKQIRAFDKRTGRLLWQHELPAAGFATPSTYEAGGKQYIVIACGGGKLGAPKGDRYVAFSLP